MTRQRLSNRLVTPTAAEADDSDALCLEDFVAYLPKHNYVFLRTREPWPASSVNARIAPVEDDVARQSLHRRGSTGTVGSSK
jgi:hypothetical protein